MGSRFNPFRSLFGALMFSAMALLLVAGLKSYRDLSLAKQREEVLEERIARTQQRVREFEQRIERLRDDPATLERLAREHNGMVRPDDLVIVLPYEAGEAPPSDAPPPSPRRCPRSRSERPAPRSKRSRCCE